MADKNNKVDPNEKVVLVALEAFSPYKKGDVFTVTRKEADLVLNADPRRENEFGPVYPRNKVREFEPERDEYLLKEGGFLNQKEIAVADAKETANNKPSK